LKNVSVVDLTAFGATSPTKPPKGFAVETDGAEKFDPNSPFESPNAANGFALSMVEPLVGTGLCRYNHKNGQLKKGNIWRLRKRALPLQFEHSSLS
jgi:hypothetical protein